MRSTYVFIRTCFPGKQSVITNLAILQSLQPGLTGLLDQECLRWHRFVYWLHAIHRHSRQASASIGKHHYSTIIQHIQPRCDSETFLNQKTSQKAVGSVLPLDVAGGLEMPTIIPKVTTINTASTGVVGHNFACPCRTRSDQDHLQSLKCE